MTTSRLSDEFVEHLSHGGRVTAHDGGRCRDVAVGVKVLPVENEARIAGELVKERALGPAVALAEWVDGVDLTKVVGETLGERIPGKAAQEVVVMQRPEDGWRF
jgi:hypothetical protein